MKAINALTETQREAIMSGLAKQVNTLRDENEDMKEEIDDLRAERDKLKERSRPNIKRDAFWKKIQEYPDETEQTRSQNTAVAIVASPATEMPPQMPPAPMQSTTILAVPESAPAGLAEDSDAVMSSGTSAVAVVPSSAIEMPPQTPLSPLPRTTILAAPESAPARAVAQSPWRRIVSGLNGQWFPGLRKRPAEDAATGSPAPKVRVIEQPESSLVPEQSPVRPHTTGKMMSAKNLNVPSSLSTVTEYTEPPSFVESVPDTTPSKKRRNTSTSLADPILMSRIPTITPTASAAPMRTSRTAPSTPMQKPSAIRRANRLNGLSSNSATPRVPYAWEKNAAKPKPKETNADARLEKLKQLEFYRAQVAALEADSDIRDIEGHTAIKRKKVNVDKLKVIPHNRPGDSSSTFRVPDIDSDDEMSVDEDVEETPNIFEENDQLQTENEQMQTQHEQMQTQYDQVQVQTPSNQVQMQDDEFEIPVFEFPNVAPRPADYEVNDSEEYREQAGRDFAAGFAAWVAAGGPQL